MTLIKKEIFEPGLWLAATELAKQINTVRQFVLKIPAIRYLLFLDKNDFID